MAKELPYFRFTSQEWQNGNISLESYELKGLFIDVCAYYWVQDCSITRTMLEKRYKDAKELINELIKLEIIKHEIDTDFITIQFLNDQFDLLSTMRKSRQGAGSKGGKQKSSNAKAKLKQNPSYKDNDNDNNKDKEKEKDNIEYIYSLYPSKCAISNRSTGKCAKDKIKIETLLKTKSVDELSNSINLYIADCLTTKTYIKNFSTFLNNIPDITEQKKPQVSDENKIYVWTVAGSVNPNREYTGSKKLYENDLNGYGADKVKLISNGN